MSWIACAWSRSLNLRGRRDRVDGAVFFVPGSPRCMGFLVTTQYKTNQTKFVRARTEVFTE